ncbi:MAG: hypothetical protein KGN77_05805 [Xanthomonadaceae bacterium]|nr:hypothetical protein [Xanthomonadaceae bacterium]MDE1964372.1 hypothetical protein [Xanthomonadaceae bacterium]
MTFRLVATLAGLALAGLASAQSSSAAAPAASTAPGRAVHAPGAWHRPILPLPPGCRERPWKPATHPVFPDFNREGRWQAALGISADQARRVQQLFEQRRKDDQATCDKLRGIVGDQAMARWVELSALPPPPPPPPAPDAPRPPEPPLPPPPPVDAQ